MCLFVKQDAEIFDDKYYYFYKIVLYQKNGGFLKESFYSPYMGTSLFSKRELENNKPIPLIGKYKNKNYKYVNLPVSGAKAYPICSEDKDNESFVYVHEGIHAYCTLARAKRMRLNYSYVGKDILKIRVKGKNIIAFGHHKDVAFTRGEIVQIYSYHFTWKAKE